MVIQSNQVTQPSEIQLPEIQAAANPGVDDQQASTSQPIIQPAPRVDNPTSPMATPPPTQIMGALEEVRYNAQGRPLLPESADQLRTLATHIAAAEAEAQYPFKGFCSGEDRRDFLANHSLTHHFTRCVTRQNECLSIGLITGCVASVAGSTVAGITLSLILPSMYLPALPAYATTCAGSAATVLGFCEAVGQPFIGKNCWVATKNIELMRTRSQQTEQNLANYLANPIELQDAIARRNRASIQGDIRGTALPSVRYAYAPEEEHAASIIKRNILRKLPGIAKNNATCLQEIKALCAAQQISTATGRMYHLLDSEIPTGKRELQLVWNYLDQFRPDNKEDFVHYLASSEGCAHGRGSQILMFFEGLDVTLLPQPDRKRLKEFPVLPHKQTALVNEIYAFVSLAQKRHTQTQGDEGISLEADKKQTQAYIQPFAMKDNKTLAGEKLQPMSKAVFERAFGLVWDKIDV